MPKPSKRPARRDRKSTTTGNGGVKSEDLTAQLLKQLEQDEPVETVEMVFDGVRMRVRRFDIQGWAISGRMPQFLVNAVLEGRAKVDQGQEPEQEPETPEQYWQEAAFTRDVVCYVTVEPNIVDKDESALATGEISYRKFIEKKPKVAMAVAAWAVAGCPNMPVQLANGGQTSVAAVTNFREGAGGAETTPTRTSGSADRQTEPTVRAI